MLLLSSADFFFKINFHKKLFQEYYQSVSHGLDPDQDRYFVGPDLGPNCLKRLSADVKSPLTRKELQGTFQLIISPRG